MPRVAGDDDSCRFARHCERSEAIQGKAKSYWIASSPFGLLAMTDDCGPESIKRIPYDLRPNTHALFFEPGSRASAVRKSEAAARRLGPRIASAAEPTAVTVSGP